MCLTSNSQVKRADGFGGKPQAKLLIQLMSHHDYIIQTNVLQPKFFNRPFCRHEINQWWAFIQRHETSALWWFQLESQGSQCDQMVVKMAHVNMHKRTVILAPSSIEAFRLRFWWVNSLLNIYYNKVAALCKPWVFNYAFTVNSWHIYSANGRNGSQELIWASIYREAHMHQQMEDLCAAKSSH